MGDSQSDGGERMTAEDIKSYLAETNPDMLFADGFFEDKR